MEDPPLNTSACLFLPRSTITFPKGKPIYILVLLFRSMPVSMTT